MALRSWARECVSMYKIAALVDRRCLVGHPVWHVRRLPSHSACSVISGSCVRYMSTNLKNGASDGRPEDGIDGKDITPGGKDTAKSLSVYQVAVKEGKNVFYLLVVLAGVVGLGYFLSVLTSELFSRESTSQMYNRSAKLVTKNKEVQHLCGSPVKCYQENRLGHIIHQRYVENGHMHVHLQFQAGGPFRMCTVHANMKEVTPGSQKYDYHYLIVQTDGYPPQSITLIDNR